VKFHCLFYSDFALGEVKTDIMRVSGLVVINGSIDENGMLAKPQGHVYDSEVPQLVLMPFISQTATSVP
jgi:hypothetical protein